MLFRSNCLTRLWGNQRSFKYEIFTQHGRRVMHYLRSLGYKNNSAWTPNSHRFLREIEVDESSANRKPKIRVYYSYTENFFRVKVTQKLSHVVLILTHVGRVTLTHF